MNFSTRFTFAWLTAAFFFSFFQYVVDERYLVGTLGPLMLVILAVLLHLHPRLNQGTGRELDGDPKRKRLGWRNLIWTVALPVMPLATSLYNELEYSVLYGLLFIATLVAVRLILSKCQLATVLAAVCLAGLLSLPFILIKIGDYGGSYTQWGRFQPYSFHPNLVAFILTPLPGLLVWTSLYMRASLRSVALVAAMMPVMIAYVASSRGSLFAIVLATVACVLVADYKFKTGTCKTTSKQGSAYTFILKWVFISLSVGILAYSDPTGILANTDLVDALDLLDDERGLQSGLTGRVYNWERLVADVSWSGMIFGHGFRATEILVPYDIDNGFFVMYFDFGLLISVLVYGRFVYVGWQIMASVLATRCRARIVFLVACLYCVLAFFFNNIVARYLFGLGNPFSLLGLFFFVSNVHDFRPREIVPSRSMAATCNRRGGDRCREVPAAASWLSIAAKQGRSVLAIRRIEK